MQVVTWLKINGTKRYGKWSQGHVASFKNKPTTTDTELAVKITLEIPDEVFEEPVYEVKLTLPKTTKQFPEMAEVLRETQKALTDKMGFKVKLEMPIENQPSGAV